MPVALRKDKDALTLDAEGRRRINAARVSKLAFELKQTYPDLSGDDAARLADVVLEAMDAGEQPTGEEIRHRLVQNGMSVQSAEQVAGAVGL